jgi:hypothetical protein
MSVTDGVPRDVLRANVKAVAERRRRHRERALSSGTDWRPFTVVPASVRVSGDPVGVSRPSSQCVQLDDGSWQYARASRPQEAGATNA